MGSGRLGPAPRELCLAGAQVRVRQARAPGKARQKRTLLGAGQETPALNLLFSLGAPCAPNPTRGIRPQAARMCDQKGYELELGRPQGRKTSPFS